VSLAGSSPVAPALSTPLPGKCLGPSEHGLTLADVPECADRPEKLERSLALGCSVDRTTRSGELIREQKTEVGCVCLGTGTGEQFDRLSRSALRQGGCGPVPDAPGMACCGVHKRIERPAKGV
jgi:hypothetical protein